MDHNEKVLLVCSGLARDVGALRLLRVENVVQLEVLSVAHALLGPVHPRGPHRPSASA